MQNRFARLMFVACLAAIAVSRASAASSLGEIGVSAASAAAPLSASPTGGQSCSEACYENFDAQGRFLGYSCVSGNAGYNCGAQQYTCGVNIPPGGCGTGNPGGDADITVTLEDGRVLELAEFCPTAQRPVDLRRVGFQFVRQWQALEFRSHALSSDSL